MLSTNDISNVLKDIHGEKPMICLTGGEPLLHPEFFEIASVVNEMGFYWGLTTNATLIGIEDARLLRKNKMATVTVSLDGLERSHDSLRQIHGAWEKAINGIENLKTAGYYPQITTVVYPDNIDELESVYKLLLEMKIPSWRIINVEPIGRACESSEILLNAKKFQNMISYIRAKRFDQANTMEITYGCSHYLGLETERMVRDNYFLCGAGITVASIKSNGDICACLDIESRPELVQGNIHFDRFVDVWEKRFLPFRIDRTAKSDICAKCTDRYICGGDSAHTWDYENKRPLLCGRDFMKKH